MWKIRKVVCSLVVCAAVVLGFAPGIDGIPGFGVDSAYACSIAPASLDTVLPEDGREISPETVFTVVYSGGAARSGEDLISAVLEDESGTRVPLSLEGTSKWQIAGERLRFAADAPLEPGEYRLTVYLHREGDGAPRDGGFGEDVGSERMTRSYTVRSDAGADPPVGPTDLAFATATRNDDTGEAFCDGPGKAFVQFGLTEEGATPAYAIATFEKEGAESASRISIGRDTLQSSPVEQTLTPGENIECLEVTMYDAFGVAAASADTCDPLRCGEVEQSAAFYDWEKACSDADDPDGTGPDFGDDGSGGGDGGDAGDAGGSTAWPQGEGERGGCSCRVGGSGARPVGAVALVALLCLGLRRSRRD